VPARLRPPVPLPVLLLRRLGLRPQQ